MRVKLKEIGKIVTGNTPSKKNTLYYNSNDILFIKPDILQLKKVCDINDSKEFISENARAVSRIVPKGAILITCIGIIGKIGIVGVDECAFNQQINAIVPNKNIKSKYLAYVLFYNRGRLNDIANAPVVPIINKSEFENFEVNIISDIKKQESIIQILDKIKNIIYKYACVLSYLDTLIKARFVEMFGDVSINSKSWVSDKMGNYMTLLTDFSSNGSYKTLDSNVVMKDEPDYAWIVRTTDLEEHEFEKVKYIDEKTYNFLSKSKLFGNEIIMCKIGSAGNVYLMPKIDKPASLGRNAFLFRYDNRINRVYLYQYLTSEHGKKEIKSKVRGAVTKTITKEDARNINVLVPPIELQNEYEKFVHHIDKSKFDIQKSLEKTQMLFDSLMQEYFG